MVDNSKKEPNQIKQDIHSYVLNESETVENPLDVKEFIIGDRVRSYRKQKGLSIRSLAEKCGVSVNTLSLIENGKTSPNVNTLKLFAEGLEISILAFFEEEKPEHGPVYQQYGHRPQMQFSNGTLEKLGEGLPSLGAEPILVTLEHTEDDVENISHAGREFIYCLEGKVTCFILDQPYQLLAGDSLLFNAQSPHHWVNAQRKSSKLLVLFCPMDPQDQAAERHLDP